MKTKDDREKKATVRTGRERKKGQGLEGRRKETRGKRMRERKEEEEVGVGHFLYTTFSSLLFHHTPTQGHRVKSSVDCAGHYATRRKRADNGRKLK